jgi:hypothetical protein
VYQRKSTENQKGKGGRTKQSKGKRRKFMSEKRERRVENKKRGALARLSKLCVT